MVGQYRYTVLALTAILGFAPATGQALSTDREKPIVIEAAAAEADNRTQITVYRGDVP